MTKNTKISDAMYEVTMGKLSKEEYVQYVSDLKQKQRETVSKLENVKVNQYLQESNYHYWTGNIKEKFAQEAFTMKMVSFLLALTSVAVFLPEISGDYTYIKHQPYNTTPSAQQTNPLDEQYISSREVFPDWNNFKIPLDRLMLLGLIGGIAVCTGLKGREYDKAYKIMNPPLSPRERGRVHGL